jgi:hypothetical protein
MQAVHDLLDWKKSYELLKKNDFDLRTYTNPLKIAIGLLKSEAYVSEIIKKSLAEKYSKSVADVWMPLPKGDDVKKKEKVIENLPKILKLIHDNLDSLKSSGTDPVINATYENLKPFFKDLHESIEDGRNRMQKDALNTSNPYLTVSIEVDLEEGKQFQTAAKIASSVETIWGNWIEVVVPQFNKNLFRVGAGGFDSILGDVAFDIKSGPKVMNKGLVEDAKAKRETISGLSKIDDFKDMVAVKDFRVAIVYGKEEDADMMKNSSGMIIFGAESWKTLTGDEWNAYKLFLWQIMYEIESGKKWSKEDLQNAVKLFVCSFYGDVDSAASTALNHDLFKIVEKMCVN